MVRTNPTVVQEWIDRSACGFTVASVDAVSFQVTGNGQWSRKPLLVSRQVPGSNSVIRQLMGYEPWKVMYDLALATVDDLASLLALQGMQGTLVLNTDIAAVTVRRPAILGGLRYDRLFNATLALVSGQQFARGIHKCQAAFEVDDA